MINYLDKDIRPLVIGNSFSECDGDFTHIPVVNTQKEWLGVLECGSEISSGIENANRSPLFIVPSQINPLSACMRMKELDSNILFVVENGSYVGAITYASIIHYLQDHSDISHDSAALKLVVPSYQYSLAELSRISESENNRIVSLNTHWINMETIELDLVFQTNDLKRIIGILENKGYQVVQMYNENDLHNHLLSRYENLMTYLNI